MWYKSYFYRFCFQLRLNFTHIFFLLLPRLLYTALHHNLWNDVFKPVHAIIANMIFQALLRYSASIKTCYKCGIHVFLLFFLPFVFLFFSVGFLFVSFSSVALHDGWNYTTLFSHSVLKCLRCVVNAIVHFYCSVWIWP